MCVCMYTVRAYVYMYVQFMRTNMYTHTDTNTQTLTHTYQQLVKLSQTTQHAITLQIDVYGLCKFNYRYSISLKGHPISD